LIGYYHLQAKYSAKIRYIFYSASFFLVLFLGRAPTSHASPLQAAHAKPSRPEANTTNHANPKNHGCRGEPMCSPTVYYRVRPLCIIRNTTPSGSHLWGVVHCYKHAIPSGLWRAAWDCGLSALAETLHATSVQCFALYKAKCRRHDILVEKPNKNSIKCRRHDILVGVETHGRLSLLEDGIDPNGVKYL
jgi:hypothetical protein